MWNGRPGKINKNTLIGDLEKDELKMIDVDSYLIFSKASWISSLNDSTFSNWKLIPLTINLFTLSNKLLYNKLVNAKFSKFISAYHWIN